MRFPANLLVFTLLLATATVRGKPEPADLVVLNANIRTMAREKPQAEAVAIKDGKFIAVGRGKEITAFIGPRTKKIDANGQLLLPGFNDAHVHFAAIGNRFSSIDLRSARSPAEMAEMLAYYAKFLPKGRWILGRGWDNSRWPPGDLPTRLDIDAVTPENPVFVYHADGFSALANSLALKNVGLDGRLRPALELYIDRRATREPTGILRGPAMEWIGREIPKNHTRNWPEILETASNYAASFGVTSVQDMHSDELADVYRQLNTQGKLKTRVYDCSPVTSIPALAAKGMKAATGDAFVRAGCIKYFSDGDPSEAEELQRKIAAADRAGLQVMIHAIGASANRIVLDAFEKTIKENGPRDRRLRVEHAQNALVEDLPRFARSKIIASMQPWLFFNGASRPTVFKQHLEMNTPLAFGSDASITDLNPLLGIYAAATGPNAITVEQAVRAYTVGSAFSEFQENVKGTIEPGKLADFVLIDKDIFRVPMADLRSAKVTATFVDGVQVYASK